jgi:hypothetical protein
MWHSTPRYISYIIPFHTINRFVAHLQIFSTTPRRGDHVDRASLGTLGFSVCPAGREELAGALRAEHGGSAGGLGDSTGYGGSLAPGFSAETLVFFWVKNPWLIWWRLEMLLGLGPGEELKLDRKSNDRTIVGANLR